MDTIEVPTLKPEEYLLWDKLVELSPMGTIFHTSQWIATAGSESKVKTEFFGAFSSGQLVGGCAIYSHKIAGLFTSAITTLPLTPYGGVIMQPLESSKIREREKYEWSIINSLLSGIQSRQPHILSLTMSPQVTDIRPYTWQGWNESVKYCYILPLSGNITDRVSKKVRWSVNKAKKLGIATGKNGIKIFIGTLFSIPTTNRGPFPHFHKNCFFHL